MSAQRLRDYFLKNWQCITVCGVTLGILGVALLWQLHTLVPGYSASEVQTYQNSLSFRAILDNPLNAPFLVAVRAVLYIHPDSYFAVRLVSVAYGVVTLAIFALLLRHWHSTRTAIYGSLLFGLSAWFLHTARLGTPDVLMFGVFVLAAGGFWLKHTRSKLALFLCFVGSALLLYVPGMVWYVALGLAWQWKAIDRVFKRHLAVVSAGALAMLGLLAPLAYGLYKHHDLIRPLLGLPDAWPSPWQIFKNALLAPFHFFVHNTADPVTWLGNAPVLDVFSLTMLILGLYVYLRHARLARAPIFLFVFIVTLGLMAVGSPAVNFTVVIPFVYIIIASGVTHLLGEWFRVFPRNPIARSIGWSLMSLVVGIACLYHVIHYFVGWPQAEVTHDAFTAQRPDQP